MSDYSPFWDDPLHDERQEAQRARHDDLPPWDDRPTRAELAEDEREIEQLARERHRLAALDYEREAER